eukprot:m.303 g.303  ORF g.303 m.303 type:complete len:632 (+) comp246_c1_seq1:101-1996(+)
MSSISCTTAHLVCTVAMLVLLCKSAAVVAVSEQAIEHHLDQFTDLSGATRDLFPWQDMFQAWSPRWDGPLTRLDIYMGSIEPCQPFSGTLQVFEELPSGERFLVHEQPVATTCNQCARTEQTCMFVSACKYTACLAWQEWELSEAIYVYQNTTYTFGFSEYKPVVLGGRKVYPSVGVAPASDNHGGLSSITSKKKSQKAYSQFTFRTYMGSPRPSHLATLDNVNPGRVSTADPETSTGNRSAIIAGAGALIAVCLVLVVVFVTIHRNYSSKWSAKQTPTLLPSDSDMYQQGSKVAWTHSTLGNGTASPARTPIFARRYSVVAFDAVDDLFTTHGSEFDADSTQDQALLSTSQPSSVSSSPTSTRRQPPHRVKSNAVLPWEVNDVPVHVLDERDAYSTYQPYRAWSAAPGHDTESAHTVDAIRYSVPERAPTPIEHALEEQQISALERPFVALPHVVVPRSARHVKRSRTLPQLPTHDQQEDGHAHSSPVRAWGVQAAPSATTPTQMRRWSVQEPSNAVASSVLAHTTHTTHQSTTQEGHPANPFEVHTPAMQAWGHQDTDSQSHVQLHPVTPAVVPVQAYTGPQPSARSPIQRSASVTIELADSGKRAWMLTSADEDGSEEWAPFVTTSHC